MRRARPEPEIALQNPNRYPEAAAGGLRPWLAELVAALAPALAPGRPASLGVRFASDREMRRVNRTFRGKDRTTDVLSFPALEPNTEPGMEMNEEGPEPAARHLGDVLISVPAARRQAAAAGHGVPRELRLLLLHGLLHCLGHDHETDDGRMERRERRLRRAWLDRPAPATGAPR